jgi:RNA polymerase sigma-70 factor (ECF subfamily)
LTAGQDHIIFSIAFEYFLTAPSFYLLRSATLFSPEGIRMFDYACATRCLCFAPMRLGELAPMQRYHPEPGLKLDDWPEDELARVRAVLKKLAALRVDSPDDAEDLVQETLVTMTEKCPQIALQKGLLIWGMGILRKKIGNHYRKNRRFTSWEELISKSQDGAGSAGSMPEQESRVHQIELCDLLNRALASFPPRERVAVELYLAGSPAREIADLLYPERYQNIVNWVHRGRKKLARELRRYGYP